MADIKAKIQIHETGNGTINHVYTSVQTNNVSELPFATDIVSWVNGLNANNKYFDGANANVLQRYKIGDSTNGYLAVKNANNEIVESYKGVMFGSTNSNNVFALTLTFVGFDIGDLKIVFDKLIGNYPTTYILKETVSGVVTTTTHTNSSVELQLTGLNGGATQIELIFSSWYKANSNVGITFIENQVISRDFAKNLIDSFEVQNQLTSSPQTADYGVLANTGSLRLLDKDNIIYNDAEKGYLQMNSFGVELYVNNRLLQKHIVIDNPYYSADKKMDIALTDKLTQLTTEIPDHQFTGSSISLYGILEYVMTYSGFAQGQVAKMFVRKYDEEDEESEEYDITTVIGDPNLENADIFEVVTMRKLFDEYLIAGSFTLKGGTLLDQLTKICQCAQVYLTTNRKGDFKFSSARTTLDILYGDIIEIPYNKQASAFSFDILTNNRYNFVETGNGISSYNNNVLEYGSNEILDTLDCNTEHERELQSTVLASDIVFDYRNGVKTGTIDIFPGNYDNYDGDTRINWSNGEMIEIGDIVYIMNKTWETSMLQPNGEPVYWRVVDRKVKYDGQIIISLTLKQVERYDDLL